MSWLCSTLLFIGRIALAAVFLVAGIGKFVNYDGTVQYMASKGLSAVPALLIVAALAEIIAALALIFGFKTRFGALILLVFLIPTTLIFHDFWNYSDPMSKMLQTQMFLKNIAIMGGLLYVLAVGAGRLSIDRCCSGCSHSCYVCGCSHSETSCKTCDVPANNTKV